MSEIATPEKSPDVKLPSTLPFNITPKILQDLGFNLYTKLDRVIVEFLANAYDADATGVSVELRLDRIQKAREVVKKTFEAEHAKYVASEGKLPEPDPLETRTLNADIGIRITDDGLGMGHQDLAQKFLNVSRRRREEEGSYYSPGGRPLMGRKGLGKLAGFGIAHRIVVTSKRAGDANAYRIVLDYDTFKDKSNTAEIVVPLTEIEPGDSFPKGSGTIVELSKLVYSGFQRDATIKKSLARHFRMVVGFSITLDQEDVSHAGTAWSYAFPALEDEKDFSLVTGTIKCEDGREFSIRYRLYFHGSGRQLPTDERGVRIYCHNRMAAPPDLFGILTSADGYMYSSYLEGVVEADYIDEQKVDYVATDRQGLRWDNPLLEPLYSFVKDAVTKALTTYGKVKEIRDDKKVDEDPFTADIMRGQSLEGKRLTQGKRIAKVLAKNDSDGVAGSFYRATLPVVIRALGHGDILSAITQLAKDPSPAMSDVVRELADLTRYEFEGFVTLAEGRLKGLEALKKLKGAHDFKKPNNEKDLQKLLQEIPWIIDPTFYQFLSADASEQTMFHELARHLEIGEHVPNDYSQAADEEVLPYRKNKRPDLVFLLGNKSLQKLVIVELKSLNTPLLASHLAQMQRYMLDAETWLAKKYPELAVKVSGMLIGTREPGDSKAEGVRDLAIRESERADNAKWQVFDVSQILDRAYDAHKELLDVAARHR